MKIAIASDHGGYQLKELLKEYIKGMGEYEILDLGTDSEESVDYPAYGIAVGEAVSKREADKGIVCCGTGLGISISCPSSSRQSSAARSRFSVPEYSRIRRLRTCSPQTESG